MTALKDSRLEEMVITQNVRASALTITGQLVVEIPGRAPYEGVDRVEISHFPAMDVEVTGAQKKDGKDILMQSGTISATGYRSDPAVRELYKSDEVRVVKDPHVAIYRGTQEIRLSQVQGVPVVKVADGRLSYQ